MTGLPEKHREVLSLIGERPFHYVDVPVHGNIGDLLIMQGTLAFFRRHELKPDFITDCSAYDDSAISPSQTIVFHGGGNFGDIYPKYQKLRERVVSNRLRNRIVILPQSLHFSSKAARESSSALFRRHPDLHICVRDMESLEVAREFSDHVYLLPDMAHQLYPLPAGNAPRSGALIIRRSDTEGHRWLMNDLGQAGKSVLDTDWPQFVGRREYMIKMTRFLLRTAARLGATKPAYNLVANIWIPYANMLTADAVRLFQRNELIVTDRLHGHILASLINKRHVLIDNSYGKNSRYVKAWTSASPLLTQKKI
jgi:pyruvyl transferase EpsO